MISFSYLDFLLWPMGFRRRFKVKGDSMLPLLREGDNVFLKSTVPSKDDVIIAKRPLSNILMVKRVADIVDENEFVLEGVNKYHSSDSRSFGTISRSDIVGVVTSKF